MPDAKKKGGDAKKKGGAPAKPYYVLHTVEPGNEVDWRLWGRVLAASEEAAVGEVAGERGERAAGCLYAAFSARTWRPKRVDLEVTTRIQVVEEVPE